MTIRPLALALGSGLVTVTLCMGTEHLGPEEYAQALHATPDLEHGGQIYHDHCEMCHGATGDGYPGPPAAPFPVTGGQHFRVLVMALVRFRHGGTSIHGMQYSTDKDRLSGAQDVADVATYVAALQPAAPAGMGSGLSLAQGARVYLRYCESCHGPTGQGDAAKPVPRLAGQHYRYLVRKFDSSADTQRKDELHTRRIQQLQILTPWPTICRGCSGLSCMIRDPSRDSTNSLGARDSTRFI